jgi:hypothetical protein
MSNVKAPAYRRQAKFKLSSNSKGQILNILEFSHLSFIWHLPACPAYRQAGAGRDFDI